MQQAIFNSKKECWGDPFKVGMIFEKEVLEDGAEGLLKLFMLSSILAMHLVGLNNDFSDDLYVYLIIQFPILVKILQAE